MPGVFSSKKRMSRRGRLLRAKRRAKLSLNFGNYQQSVNNLTGALGPNNSAYWRDLTTTTGAPYSLGAQPLYYVPSKGIYGTSATGFESQGTADFSSFGFGSRYKKCKRKCKSKCKRKYKSKCKCK